MLKRLLDNLVIQNKNILIYFVFYTITASIYPFFSVLLPKLLVDELTKGDNASLEYILTVIVGYFILAGIFGFIKIFLKDTAYPKIFKLRIDYIRDMFNKIVTIDYKYMEDACFFEENERALKATSSNDNGVEGVYHKMFELPELFITIFIFTFFIGKLNVFILLGLVLNILVPLWVNKEIHNYQYSIREQISHADRKIKYYYETTHDFSYGKDIRIYDFKNRILDNYSNEINDYVNIFKKIRNKEYTLGFLGLLALLISDSLTYGIIIYKTVNGMSIADFSMYLVAIISLVQLLRTFTTDISYTINEGHYVHDFFEFMDKDLGEKGGNKSRINEDPLEIEFKDVSFKYPKTEKYIFKNLNFKINKGERLAIVGINGAGKSTLVKLMTGLFDATDGDILINGISIKEFDKQELYSMFSVVFQDVNVLAFTIKENVACTSKSIDENRVVTALDKVGLYDKVKEFPKGLNQFMLKIIENDGTEFSGGESQKLSIARALYKDGNMVIMDEPTAALDALAEAEIYENFSELVKGKTAVYISHRLASTKFCDKIALFDNNGLKEYGSHEELINKKGSYYNMFMIQGKYYNGGGQRNEQYQEA